jgi:hypothetical protein
MNLELIEKLTSKPELYERGSSVMWTDPHISKKFIDNVLPDMNDNWNGDDVTFCVSRKEQELTPHNT